MQQNFDFSSLDSLRPQSVHIGATMASIGLFAGFVFVTLSARSALWLIVAFVMLAGLVAAVVYIVLQWRKTEIHNEDLMHDFALKNNMAYEPKFAGMNQFGTLFDQGHSKKTTRVLSGLIADLPFHCFEYYYETGSGKSRRSYDAMVMEVTLPRVLPQFVIDSQLEDVMPIVFDKSQKIELEGDFHKYFDLYAPDTYGISALTILAPDAMEELMQHAALCDIEVVENKLLFYWPAPAKTKSQYEEIFNTAQAVITKLGKKLTQADIFGTKAQAQIHAQPGASGVRLRRSKIGFAVTVGIVLYFMAQFTEHTRFSSLGLAFIGLFWASFIGWIAFSSVKRASLKSEYLKRYRSKRY